MGYQSAYPDCEAAEDLSDYKAPDDLDDASKERWLEVIAKHHSDHSSLKQISARVIAQNPAAYEEFVRQARVDTMRKMSGALSRSGNFLLKDLNLIHEVLTLSTSEIGGVLQALHALGNSADLSLDEVQEVVNQASVLAVMEEESHDDDDAKTIMATPAKISRKSAKRY